MSAKIKDYSRNNKKSKLLKNEYLIHIIKEKLERRHQLDG